MRTCGPYVSAIRHELFITRDTCTAGNKRYGQQRIRLNVRAFGEQIVRRCALQHVVYRIGGPVLDDIKDNPPS
jgi:hypothetical protein